MGQIIGPLRVKFGNFLVYGTNNWSIGPDFQNFLSHKFLEKFVKMVDFGLKKGIFGLFLAIFLTLFAKTNNTDQMDQVFLVFCKKIKKLIFYRNIENLQKSWSIGPKGYFRKMDREYFGKEVLVWMN